jgi:hypothetical protein
VIAVVPIGTEGAALAPVLERLRDRRADVLVVGDEHAAPWAAAVAPLPPTDERVAPVVQILPLQQMSRAMAVARCYDPDAPRASTRSRRRVEACLDGRWPIARLDEHPLGGQIELTAVAENRRVLAVGADGDVR